MGSRDGRGGCRRPFPGRRVSAENRGYDIESRAADGTLRFIEVKGRIASARDIILTQNEVRAALNAPERWWLAIVQIEDRLRASADLPARHRAA